MIYCKHSLTYDEAYRLINPLLANLQKEYPDILWSQCNWGSQSSLSNNLDQMNFQINISGTLAKGAILLQDKAVALNLFSPNSSEKKKEIEKRIQGQLEKSLVSA